MNGQTLQKAFVPLAGGAVAVYTSSELAYYRHSDWLGSSRFASTPTRTMYSDGAYAPFGEPYADSGTSDLSFTGMNQDTVSGLYDFAAREYATQGRWPSPDPSGIASVSINDPQTWNRYAYVRNSPLHATDPNGLQTTYWVPNGGGGDIAWMFWSGVMGFSGADGCTSDGVDVPCGMVQSMLQGGGAVQCTNNDCGLGTANPFQCVGSVCGRMTNEYASTHENELDGVLYSDDEYASLVVDRVDAQRQALADAMPYASASPDGSNWDYIYNHLNPYDGNGNLQIWGGNADFNWTGDPSFLDFVPQSDWDKGGCEFSWRYGSMNAIHFDNGSFHLDTAGVNWDFPIGAVIHGFVDVLLGNINPSLPMVP
jgi:RHS repeat-associated protein